MNAKVSKEERSLTHEFAASRRRNTSAFGIRASCAAFKQAGCLGFEAGEVANRLASWMIILCLSLVYLLGGTTAVMAQPGFTRIVGDPIIAASEGEYTAAWGDYDGDGDLDLFTGGSQKLYRNNGDGSFTSVTDSPVVTNHATVPTAAVWGDYDNDGNLDLFVAGFGIDHFFQHKLFRGLGGGDFEVIEPGISHLTRSYHASWVDYDNDGHLDLFLPDASPSGFNRLYRNGANGSFSPVEAPGLTTLAGEWTACAWGDFNGDGLMDVFLVSGSTSHPDALFRNDGNGVFTQFSAETFAGENSTGTAAAWGDYDNDGDLDLFVSTDRHLVVENGLGSSALYRNDGTAFTKIVTGELVTLETGSPGAAWGDYDNDGWLDIYVANQFRDWFTQEPVVLLYRNNRDGTFTRVTSGSPASDRVTSSSPVWVDYNDDGRLDLFLAFAADGNVFPGGGPWSNALFRNDGPTGNWLKVELTGTTSNRAGIGARVRVATEVQGASLHQMRFVGGDGGYHGQNLELHFGLGDATQATSVIVEWPSGLQTSLTDVAANQILNLQEAQEPLPDIQFVPPGRNFTNEISVALVNHVGTGVVRYTVDGSAPGPASVAYVAGGPLHLTAATTVRAQVYFNNFPVSGVFQESYSRVHAFEDDGVPFAWREQYFGPGFLTDPRADAAADSDGDGYSTRDEFLGGTSPTDDESAPAIVAEVRAVAQVTFNAIAGKTYEIRRAVSPVNPVWETIEPAFVAPSSQAAYVDENGPPGAQYQVVPVVVNP